MIAGELAGQVAIVTGGGRGIGRAVAQAPAGAAEAGLSTTRALPERDAPTAPSGLSRREAEALGRIAAGMTNREIADALVVSERTVERHAVNAYAKIGARGRTDAVAYAVRHGLVHRPAE